MKWFTEVEAGRSPHLLSYKNKILTLGSCFADEIGSRMERYGFDIMVNPFGVLYNPASIALSLKRLSQYSPLTSEDIVKDGSIYKSIYHSSDFSSSDPEELLKKVNKAGEEASSFFKSADTITLTFGTTWIYRRIEDGRVVSNCHKQPANSFERISLTFEEVFEAIAPFIKNTPEKRWFLSISPIRHLKDGAIENMISKSRLILAVNEIVSRFDNAVYFPSYEIVMDELRDYRFYGPDLLHLSAETSNFLLERFLDFSLDNEAYGLLKNYKQLFEMKRHRPLFPESKEYKALLKRIDELERYLKKLRE